MTDNSVDPVVEELIAGAAKFFAAPFDAVLEVVCLKDEKSNAGQAIEVLHTLWVDGFKSPPKVHLGDVFPNKEVHEESTSADCVWRASTQTFLRIFGNGRNISSAFISGHLKISGDMAVMARLNPVDHQSIST